MAQITLRPMWKKELAAICECTYHELNKRLKAFAETNKQFGRWKGKVQLEKEQVRMFLQHNDIIPEQVDLNA